MYRYKVIQIKHTNVHIFIYFVCFLVYLSIYKGHRIELLWVCYIEFRCISIFIFLYTNYKTYIHIYLYIEIEHIYIHTDISILCHINFVFVILILITHTIEHIKLNTYIYTYIFKHSNKTHIYIHKVICQYIISIYKCFPANFLDLKLSQSLDCYQC